MYIYAFVTPTGFKCLYVSYKFVVGHNPNVSIVQSLQLDAFGIYFYLRSIYIVG